ncbi:MAG: homoserine dehydrogenase [Candidatus Palauibacterales bacterium]|nr:homoserine dehydrogenase [Candidatus Palauibacterales bacterium]
MEYRLALIGFGNVGQGFTEILRDHGPRLLEQFGVRFRIVGVSDQLKGSVHDPAGLEPGELLDAVRLAGNFGGVQAVDRGWDGLEMARRSAADVVVELSYTDLETGEPATGHIRAALEAGKSVVTTNKGPIALHYAELSELAAERGLELGVEGTVMSGTPAVLNGMNLLRAAGIERVRGILNGTCNYILTRMEEGSTYEDALREAQENGYAEADPTGDVEGFDAAGKVVILANLLMGAPIGMEDVDRTGISALTPADIEAARDAGERWKLIGALEPRDGGVYASVRPERVPLSHPLASVSGATNAVTYSTELLGDVTLVGPGAGRLETGYAVLVDLLEIQRTAARRGA